MAKNGVDKQYGIPVEDMSCPSCGRKYGHHNTRVCTYCEECSSCCTCKGRKVISVEEFMKSLED